MKFGWLCKTDGENSYGEKAKLCYMDTDSFIIYIKTHDIYKDTEEDVDLKLWIR